MFHEIVGNSLPHLNFYFAVPLRLHPRMKQPGASIPTQDGVVIARGADSFGFLVTVHGFFQENSYCVRWNALTASE